MNKALIFWFTGLSGSGKTTIAASVRGMLKDEGYNVLILDGDDVRERLHVHLGFTEKDIKKNNEIIAGLCRKFQDRHHAIFVPIISPYRISREKAREMFPERFYEIHFCASLETVAQRDPKGLYAKAKSGEIDNLIGYSPGAVYEPPQTPDLAIDSGNDSVEGSIRKFHEFVVAKLSDHYVA